MPPELRLILLLSLLNPAAIAVGFLLGRSADQPQKIVLAGFIAGLAGAALAWLLMAAGLTSAGPRLLTGIFITSGIVGVAAGWAGYRFRPR